MIPIPGIGAGVSPFQPSGSPLLGPTPEELAVKKYLIQQMLRSSGGDPTAFSRPAADALMPGGMPLGNGQGMSWGDRATMAPPPEQQSALAQMRAVNRMSPDQVNSAAADIPNPPIPPQLAQMMAQRQQAESALPQNLFPGLSPFSGEPELPPEVSQMASNGDPTNLAARMAMRAAPERNPQINPEQLARLVALSKQISGMPTGSPETPNFAGTDMPQRVMSSPLAAQSIGEASRLRAMAGAPQGPLPGLTGNSQAPGGIQSQMNDMAAVDAMREQNFAKTPGLREKIADRDTAAAKKQADSRKIITDRARLNADRRQGITPQMRLLDQMVQGGAGGAGGEGDEFTRNAMLYGPEIATRIAEASARTNLAKGQLGLEERKVIAQEGETKAAQGELARQQKVGEAAAAAEFIKDPANAAPGTWGSFTDPQVKAGAIRQLLKKSNNRLIEIGPRLEQAGVPPQDILAAYPEGLPRPTYSSSIPGMGEVLRKRWEMSNNDSENAYRAELYQKAGLPPPEPYPG